MFLLAELKDTIRIPPEIFHMKLIDAVKDEINRKLANKVSNPYWGQLTIWNQYLVIILMSIALFVLNRAFFLLRFYWMLAYALR